MPTLLALPGSVLFLVGREQFTPPRSFDGGTCVSTVDCVAVAVSEVADGPVAVTLSPAPGGSGLRVLGEFDVETEGQLSVRDLYNREHESVGVPAGAAHVVVWGDADDQPSEVALQFSEIA